MRRLLQFQGVNDVFFMIRVFDVGIKEMLQQMDAGEIVSVHVKQDLTDTDRAQVIQHGADTNRGDTSPAVAGGDPVA